MISNRTIQELRNLEMRAKRESGGARLASIAAVALAALLAAPSASASMFQGETLAKVANGIAIVVIVLVPIVAIVVFWMVHVLPEKIAHKRHHPQTEAIQVLCLLSLVFGGLLWPIAWLWAYTKPVLHKMAYGTDKHDHYYAELAAKDNKEATSLRDDVARLRQDLETLLAKGDAPEELSSIRDQLAALEPHLVGGTEETR
jgi:CBS domain containing-hemolysin-like protein